LTFEREFTEPVARNDVAAIAAFVADDWVIVDADGAVIDRSRFLSVIESGA
jgi:ketosteroid isomerase-like protein